MYGTVHDIVHIYGLMTWRWLMMWHWLMTWQHSIGRMMWYWLLMWRWLMSWRWSMMCRNPIRLKWLCRVDQRRGRMSVDQKTCVRYMHYTEWEPCWCVLLNQNLSRGAILNVQIVLIQSPRFTNCIYKKGAPPNSTPLNSFLSSIFCNSLSILYLLHILINSYFTHNSIMSS